MEFDVSRVFTAVNANKLKVGSKVYVADTIGAIREIVKNDSAIIDTIKGIMPENMDARFFDGTEHWHLAYLVSEPEEKKLKVSDLKIGDTVRRKNGKLEFLVTGIDYDYKSVFFGDDWSDDTDLENWEKVENEKGNRTEN